MNNLIECKFAIEDGQVFTGWYNPTNKYWNGWLNPYVNAETHDAIIAYMMDGLDTRHAVDSGEYDDLKEMIDATPNEDGLYFWGCCYIWSEVEGV